MAWFKRVSVFLLVNILVVTVLSIVLSVLNIGPYFSRSGISYSALMVFCLVWGMGGALISLALSRMMAKMMMGVHLVDAQTRDPMLCQLVQDVHRLAREAGLSSMPEVGIYRSCEVNAFATGPTQSRSLVAVSSALLERMDHDEIRGVLAHEISHIANGDMVTMTLLQGVLNAFVMFLARIAAYTIARGGREKESQGCSYLTYHLLTYFLQSILMLLAGIVIAAFSRYREFRADASAARLAGPEKMISALKALKRVCDLKDPKTNHSAFQAFKISSPSSSLFFRLFASHPSLEQRIKRLENF